MELGPIIMEVDYLRIPDQTRLLNLFALENVVGFLNYMERFFFQG